MQRGLELHWEKTLSTQLVRKQKSVVIDTFLNGGVEEN